MEKNQKKLFAVLIIAAILIAALPFLALKGAEFGGSDDAGSVMVEKIHGEYESLLFCVQTGIGVGIIAFFMGRLYERKKLGKDNEEL